MPQKFFEGRSEAKVSHQRCVTSFSLHRCSFPRQVFGLRLEDADEIRQSVANQSVEGDSSIRAALSRFLASIRSVDSFQPSLAPETRRRIRIRLCQARRVPFPDQLLPSPVDRDIISRRLSPPLSASRPKAASSIHSSDFCGKVAFLFRFTRHRSRRKWVARRRCCGGRPAHSDAAETLLGRL